MKTDRDAESMAEAKAACAAWAREFWMRANRAGEPNVAKLVELRAAEILLDDADDPSRLRRAMAALPAPLAFTALVNTVHVGTAMAKLDTIAAITGVEICRREYFLRLERVHFYVAGVLRGANVATLA